MAVDSNFLLWIVLSTSAILTTRILGHHLEHINPYALLLTHLAAALALHAVRTGTQAFIHLQFMDTIRSTRCGSFELLELALYLLFTAVSLVCGYTALIGLPNLPLLAFIFASNQIPIYIFQLWFALLFLKGRVWIVLAATAATGCVLLFGAVTTWSSGSNNAMTVGLGLVSSTCGGLARMLHPWILDHFGYTTARKREDFQAFVLSVQVIVTFGGYLLSSPSFGGLRDCPWTTLPLVIMTIIPAAGAMDLDSSIFVSMRGSLFDSLHRMEPTSSAGKQYALLMLLEALLASCFLSAGQVTAYIIFTIAGLVLQDGLCTIPVMLRWALECLSIVPLQPEE